MMATGWLVGFYMVRAAARRLGVALNVGLLTFAIGLSGLLASKLYLVVESPARLLSHPAEIWHRTGFTFYGAVLGVIAIIPVLARFNRVSTWTLLDLLSPACALGYGIGRVGCFLAGDGDYGKPTTLPWGMTYPHGIVPTDIPVHPTELYEIAISIAIATHLWRLLNSRGSLWAVPGAVFSQYLIWTGLARFIVEFIKLNPIVFWGLTNAQIVGALSVAAGLLLWQGTRAKAVNAKTSSQGAVLGGAFRFRTTAD
jgi:phosphatidylglycerol:prolipoprotein diacylglycerol transferase